MKLNKLVLTGALGLTFFGLAGFTNSPAAAKKAYISAITTLNNSKVYNVQDMKIKVDSFKATGNGAAAINAAATGANLDLKASLDNSDKIAQYDFKGSALGQTYRLTGYLAPKGFYVNTNDLKQILKTRAAVSSSTSFDQDFQLFLADHYLLVDATSLNQNLAPQTTWSATLNQIFSGKQAQTSTKALNNLPATAFSQSGNKLTLNFSLKNNADFVNFVSANSVAVPAAQLKQELSLISNSIVIKNYSVKTIIDTKAHSSQSTISADVKAKASDSSVNFKISVNSTVSKSTAKIVVPTSEKTLSSDEFKLFTSLLQD